MQSVRLKIKTCPASMHPSLTLCASILAQRRNVVRQGYALARLGWQKLELHARKMALSSVTHVPRATQKMAYCAKLTRDAMPIFVQKDMY
jgi:hypothetical protein